MIPGRAPRARPARHLHRAAIAVIGLAFSACLSNPSPNENPASAKPSTPVASQNASSPPPMPASEAQGEGTTLKTADPSELARVHDELGAPGKAIIMGSPSSLAKAKSLLVPGALANITEDDARALSALADGISALIYGESDHIQSSPSPPETTLASGRGPQAAAPTNETAAKAALRLFSEAAAGRIGTPPPAFAGNPLIELVPGLAIFASSSRESARQALGAFERFSKLGSVSVIPDLALGLDAERRLDWSAALERYTAAHALASDTWPAALGSARSLLALRRPVSALAALSPYSATLSGLIAFAKPWAEALYKNGRFAEAEGPLSRALAADPQDSRLLLLRASLLARSGAFQRALPLVDAYMTVDQSSLDVLLLKCLVSEGIHNKEEALRWAKRGMELYPLDPRILVADARILFSIGGASREQARMAAEQALKAVAGQGKSGSDLLPGAEPSPVDAADISAAGLEAARLLAADAASRFDWKAAAGFLSQTGALRNFPDKSLAATILRKSGDTSSAFDFANAWYTEMPDSEAAAEAYLRAMVDSGKERTAQDLIARFLISKKSGEFRSVLYFLQARLQKSDEARGQLLRQALVEDAENYEALAALSDIEVSRKDYAKARFYLKQALFSAPDDPDLLRRLRELDLLAGG